MKRRTLLRRRDGIRQHYHVGRMRHMDARQIDEKGFTVCPNCGKHYYPKLGKRDPDQIIQVQFPKATPIEREQLITGLCSDKCWKEYLGHGKRERTRNENMLKAKYHGVNLNKVELIMSDLNDISYQEYGCDYRDLCPSEKKEIKDRYHELRRK